MDPSLTIARLIGPVLSVIGIGMLVDRETYRAIGVQFLQTSAIIYISGVLLLLGGLTILNKHPRWTADWRSVITAVGWIFTMAGTFRILAPQFVTFVGGAILPNAGFIMGLGVALLALGGFITFKGYVAEAAPAPLRQPETNR